MSMAPEELEAHALATLGFLVTRFGRELVAGVFHTVLGETGDEILHASSTFVADVIRAITAVVEADRVKAILDAEYDAADAIAEAAETAKLGPRT